MGREYDPDEIRTIAGRIGGLSDGMGSRSMGGAEGGPFGALSNSGDMSNALSAYTKGLGKEMSAGAKLVSATEKALRETANAMDGDEDDIASDMGNGHVQQV